MWASKYFATLDFQLAPDASNMWLMSSERPYLK